MAFKAKFTAAQGKIGMADIAIAAGSTVGDDQIAIHIDQVNLSKGDALLLIDKIVQKIHASSWPPL